MRGTLELPQNIEAERAIIGAILLEPSALDIVDEMLRGDEFYDQAHAKILKAMRQIVDEGHSIDLVTLVTALKDSGSLEEVGGISYLTKLAQSVPTAANVAQYCQYVKDAFLHRQAIITTTNLSQELRKVDPAEALAKLQMAAAEISERQNHGKGFRPISALLSTHNDVMERRYRNPNKGLTGTKTALAALDRLTGGRQKQDLIIVAARPSVGKTAFVINEAVAAAKSGTTVGFFSLEMGDTSIMDRFVSMVGHIDGMKIRTGRFDDGDWERYTHAVSELSELPIYIDSDPGMTIHQMRGKARGLRRKHENLLIIVDYLQLIHAGRKFQNRDTEIGFVAQQLKEMAKELDCPVIAISSLSRSVESRQDKRPMLSDLRESGQIEFHADEVDFLYREDYYKADTEKQNIVEVIVAKGRNTGVGTVECVYLRNFNKFLDLDTKHEAPPRRETDPRRQWA